MHMHVYKAITNGVILEDLGYASYIVNIGFKFVLLRDRLYYKNEYSFLVLARTNHLV